MELEWKTPINIPDGKQSGKIIRIDYRTDPYEYTDIVIKLDEGDFEMKYGCPTVASPNSKLGRLLEIFGAKFETKGKVDPEKVFVGKRVEFMTITKKSKKDNKEYSEIVEDSVKPVQEDVAGAKVVDSMEGD